MRKQANNKRWTVEVKDARTYAVLEVVHTMAPDKMQAIARVRGEFPDHAYNAKAA